jgi:hypothetical protein
MPRRTGDQPAAGSAHDQKTGAAPRLTQTALDDQPPARDAGPETAKI